MTFLSEYKKFILFYSKFNYLRNRKMKSILLLVKRKLFIYLVYLLYIEKLIVFRLVDHHIKKKWFSYVAMKINNHNHLEYPLWDKNYYFWHIFSKDTMTKLLINLIMKDGKKYVAYKHIYNSFIFLKKLLKTNAFLLIKKLITKKRIWFQLKTLTLRSNVLYIPRLLSIRNQITRTLKYMFHNFVFKDKQFEKVPYYKKFSYALLEELLYEKNLNYIMENQYTILRKHSSFLYKHQYKSKYTHKQKQMARLKLFKKGRKSLNRKDKQLMRFRRKLKKRERVLDKYLKEKAMFRERESFTSRYKLNLISRLRLKRKWVL